MPDRESDAEKESLIQGYVEGLLTPEESARLHHLLREDPLLARVIAQSLRMDGAIRDLTKERESALESPPPALREEASEATPLRGSPRIRSARFRVVQGPGGGNLSLQFAAVLAAAVVLLALGLLFSGSRPSGVDSVEKKDRAERREAQEARRIRAEVAEREAQATRRRAEDRLLEIDRQREALTRQQPQVAPDPEKRKAELALLDSEKARIEREMSDIIENVRKAREDLARTSERPVADPPVSTVQEPPMTEKGPAVPGTVARLAVAKVTRIAGEVSIHAGGKRTPVTATQDLLADQGVETSLGASEALVSFPDKTRVNLSADSAVRDFRIEGGKRLHIDRGEVGAVIAKQPAGQPMVFATPHGEILVVGTTIRLKVVGGGNGFTRLEVIEGKVRMTNLSKKTVEVVSGHYAIAAAGSADLQALPIPKSIAEILLEDAGAVGIKFGPAGLKLPEGFLLDSGLVYDPNRAYGWEKVVGVGQSPGNASDLLRGSFSCGGDAQQTVTWRMRIPDGSYAVTVCVGGKGAGAVDQQGPHHIAMEGKQVIKAEVTLRNNFLEKTVPVTVTDGELTVVLGGHKSPIVTSDNTQDTVMNYILIKRAEKK